MFHKLSFRYRAEISFTFYNVYLLDKLLKEIVCRSTKDTFSLVIAQCLGKQIHERNQKM